MPFTALPHVHRAWLAALLLVIVATSGCLGGEARSEWAFDVTQLDTAYGAGARGKGVVVAIIDTGVNVKHPALDHLRDGKTDNGELIAFRDFIGGVDGVNKAFDKEGHGSHVIGIMSARGSSFGDKLVNGGVDLLGASPGVQLVVARVCGDENCDATKIDDAIRWATQNGADVIGLSLGGAQLPLLQGVLQPEQGQVQEAITAAINDAIDRGVVVVAAAGNEQDDGAEDVSFPASIPGVIAVGAVGKSLQVASFSNHGDSQANRCTSGPLVTQGRCHPNQKPELVAPGVGILSAWTSDAYVRADGTSQATPFVTSAVALLLEGKPPLASRGDVNQIKQVLMDTAKELGGQSTPHDDAAGYGLVQVQSALTAYTG